ncbi:hypothetical protein ACQP1P_37315 [Dactylosporangium sp. CA-052675]|uniref:hypothetical protein n=1 Tax=Dactylosporangium sp. CA-052675 TaxID=3239927 RepID=UPI003D8CA1ED
MTQQEQHQTYVPGQRDGEREDESVAVGTAHAPYSDEDREPYSDEESYPGATYASGSADPDLADRDDVEVVDRDEALAEEERDDETRAIDRDEVDAAYDDAVREHEDHDAETDDVDAESTETTDAVDAGVVDGEVVDAEVVDDEDERDEDRVATAEAREDREWAAEHATQIRAGSTDLDEPAAADERLVEAGEGVGESEPVEREPVASTPGSVDVTAVGAVWADGAVDGLRDRWRELQLRFIDDPRSVADEADALVGEAVETITNALQAQRRDLANWQHEPGDDTERLRAAVRGYRDYLDRLLGM